MAVRAMKAGAFDFVEKPYNDALMLEVIQNALTRDLYSRDRQTRVNEIKQKVNRLTPRESEVMQLVINAKQNKVIAAELSISIKTVELHRANLMNKMDVTSPTELVRLVMMAGIESAEY